MIKKTISYTDYNGIERTEDFYFNLTKAEIADMELSTTGGFSELVKKIVDAKNVPQLVEIFKTVLHKAYGVKSPDGRRFMKNEELWLEFKETEAYSQLYMELATDDKKAADFINGVIPNMPELDTASPVSIAEKLDN